MKNLYTGKYYVYHKWIYIVAIVLAFVLLSFACSTLISNLPKPNEKLEPTSKIVYNPDGTVTEVDTGFIIDNKKEQKNIGQHNAEVKIDKDTNKIISYASQNSEVQFEDNFISGLLVDAVKCNNKQLFEKTYCSGDMLVDGVNFKNFSFEYDYTPDGKLSSQYLGADLYEASYSSNSVVKTNLSSSVLNSAKVLNSNINFSNESVKLINDIDKPSSYPTKVYKNGVQIKEYKYNNNNQVIFEADYESGIAYGYIYNGDNLVTKKLYRIFNDIAFNYETINVFSNSLYDFSQLRYNYSYNNGKLITESIIGDKTVFYSYINDKLFMEEYGNDCIEYILDGELKYSGIIYNSVEYFYGYDMLGRINSILDSSGKTVVEYGITSTGEVYSITGESASTLGKANKIIFDGNGIYNHDKALYYVANGIYDPINARHIDYSSLNNSAVSNKINTVKEYLSKSPVNQYTVIHDRVMQIVKDYFANSKVEISYGVYTTNAAEDITGIVDLFTLPYEIAPFSFANMLNGNQAYDVVYNTPSHIAVANDKMAKLTDSQSDSFISYFSSYKPLSGTMNIVGEFVFLGQLISYHSIENGLILYEIKENNKKNYSGINNVYDYDNSKYIVFNKPDYSLEMFKGVRLIAGINQEKYDQVQEQLIEVQAKAQLTVEKINAYEDPAIFNTNDHENIWDLVDIPDGQFLDFKSDGSVGFETVPEPESGRFWRNVALGVAIVATIVVTAVITVATVGCGTPLLAAVCIGVVIGATTGFVIGSVAGAAFEITNALANGNKVEWDKVGKTALEFGSICAKVGAITGGIVGGGISGACFKEGTEVATMSGAVAIENIKQGDKVLSRNDSTGKAEEKTVVNTFQKQTNKITHLSIGGEKITTTPEHPFYVKNKGYISAGNLRAGDILVDVNGKSVILEYIQHEILEIPLTVYNFEVADNHNYFVGDNKVLVHNACLKLLMPKNGTYIRALSNAGKILIRTSKNILFSQAIGVITNVIDNIEGNGIAFSVSKVYSWLKAFAKLATLTPGINKYEVHHIVAQEAKKCAEARELLETFIEGGVENAANLMLLEYELHKKKHTVKYYDTVNNTVANSVKLINQNPYSDKIVESQRELIRIAIFSALAILRVEIRTGVI